MAISREYAQYSRSEWSFQFYCFENSQSIYQYALKFLVRKHFPYLKELNEFIGRANAAGLIGKWRSNNNIRNFFKENPRNVGTFDKHHYFGALIVYGMILSTVIMSFCIEKIIYKRARMQDSSRFWLYAEMFIEPKRYFLLGNKWN